MCGGACVGCVLCKWGVHMCVMMLGGRREGKCSVCVCCVCVVHLITCYSCALFMSISNSMCGIMMEDTKYIIMCS